MTARIQSANANSPRDWRDPDDHLSHLIPALAKSLVRATRGSERMPGLESQVSILRKIVDGGPSTPAQLADELFFSRPMISNLLRGLEADHLVTRAPSLSDGRSFLVVPTEYGRDVLQQFRQGRQEVLATLLDDLDAAERERLVSALPVLEKLLAGLVEAARSVQGHVEPGP